VTDIDATKCYVLFEYKVETATWTNWFKRVDGPVAAYDSKCFQGKGEDFLAMLQHWEAFTRIDVGAYGHGKLAEFHFLTAEQWAEEACRE
jgi:hypothetical protein